MSKSSWSLLHEINVYEKKHRCTKRNNEPQMDEAVRCGESALQAVRPVLQEGFPPQATGEPEGVSRHRGLCWRSLSGGDTRSPLACRRHRGVPPVVATAVQIHTDKFVLHSHEKRYNNKSKTLSVCCSYR